MRHAETQYQQALAARNAAMAQLGIGDPLDRRVSELQQAVITAAAADLGRLGGRATSPAKAAAARANGRKGGWPKGRPRKPA